jgi:hypothetical protein
MGVAMAFAVAALGLKTAVEKQGLLSGAPQVVECVVFDLVILSVVLVGKS